MRKNQKFTAIIKGALAATLSLSMIVTSLAVMPAVTEAEDAVPVKVLDFNEGLREFKGYNFDTDKQEFPEGEGDKNFAIVKSPNIMYQKIGDQIGASDKVDANNFVYTGDGALAKYHTTTTSNQPATMYDDVKGTVYVLFDTFELKELVKNVPADVVIESTAGPEPTTNPDLEASQALDSERPVGSVVREALKVKCAAEITNPLAGSASDAVSVTYWVYVPAGATKDAALMVFDNSVTTYDESDPPVATTIKDATELFFDADSTVAPTGAWTHVAMVVTADGAKFYVNGAETAESYIVGKATVDALTSAKKLVLGGSDNGVVDTVYDTRLDDIAFYENALTAEQIKAAYDTDVAEMAVTTDVAAPDKVFKLDNLSEVTDLGKDSISIVDETISDVAVKAIKVEANKRTSTKTGFVLNENPFAGEALDGLTVGFWAKQAAECTASLMFMDDVKVVYNPKEPDQSATARSWLYLDNAGGAYFEEGAFYDCASKIKNTFSFASAVTDEEMTAAKEKATAWQYITLTANNGGFKLYVNGQPLTNQTPYIYGVRYMDGYNAAISDLEDPTALNGIFGGTNNQGATQVMSFLGFEDTKMYFGWLPTNAKLSTRTDESVYYNLSCYKSEMTAEEVAALYAQEVSALKGDDITPTTAPTSTPTDAPSVTYGDVNGNGTVEATDALLTLQAVVKLTTLTAEQEVAADVDGNAGIAAQDALCILQKVVKLIEEFPVEE